MIAEGIRTRFEQGKEKENDETNLILDWLLVAVAAVENVAL